MRPSIRLCIAFLALVTSAVTPAFVPAAHAVANHVVISEFCTRGPSAATDEFVELYNPTENPINLSGWKLQYKSATGTTWNDRATLPSNASIPAHGFFLLANQSYVGTVIPDFSSGAWNSGTGMADNGHERIIDAGAVEVDKVGWGTAIDPEGGVACPNHGTFGNFNSVERKMNAASTADSLGAGGLHALLGNGQDTNVNGNDYVVQTHGRNPQNSSSPPEPAFGSGGNGTGRARIDPTLVYTSRSLSSLQISFAQDSSYTLAHVAILVPSTWAWSHSTSSVALAGSAFGSATPTVTGDTLFIDGATLSPTDSGSVTIADLTTPAAKGGSAFTVRTATAGGPLVPIVLHPSIRVLELVPIVTLHVNDASGVQTAPYAVGSEATVTGIVTANLSDTRTDVYVQDASGGVDIFHSSLAPITLAPGDSVTVTGSILQFRGLLEIQPEFPLLVRHATGRPVPEPLVITCADLNATFHPDFTEPNEARLIRIDGVTYNSVASTITDATGTANIFIPSSYPPTPSVFDVIGVLKQFKPGTPAPGPPYTADYEISPRTPSDIIPHPGPIILTTPFEDNIQPTSVQLHWTTDVASSSIVRYGTTSALGDSIVVSTPVTSHAVAVTGLTAATVYHYSVGSGDVNGVNFTPTALFSTASPPSSTGQIHVYFNKSVNTSVATLHAASGNVDLPAQLVPRLDNARRSIDAAIYSLSGTPGGTLATALVNAKNRGVKVRVICEYDNQGTAALNTLISAGIPVINDRFDTINFGLGLMHNKFFAIDARGGAPDSAWVWTGSWNPTDPGTVNDMQNAIEVQDQALANAYMLEFNEMWGSDTDTPNAAASRFGARKLDDTPHRFSIGGRNVECYFSPSDQTTAHIISTINAAVHSVGFQVLTLTRSDIAAALITRHSTIKVRGDLDNGTDTGSEYANLVSAGVDVRLKSGVGGLLHHKYLVTDAENPTWAGTVLTGSHNWSASAENSNNENTLIVHDADIANQYLQEFVARYYQFGGSDSVVVTDAPIVGSAGEGRAWLAQNYPNPVRGSSQVVFSIPTAQRVVLRLIDVQGREVRRLVNELKPAGRHQITLDGRGLEPGVYMLRLETGGVATQRKTLILR